MNKLKEFKNLLKFICKNFFKDFIQTLKNYNKTNYNFNNSKINFTNLLDYYFYTIVYQTKFILEN